MSTRKFIKKLTASLLFIAVVMSFGVQSAFAESNSPKATVKNNVVTFSNLDQLNLGALYLSAMRVVARVLLGGSRETAAC